MKTTLAIALVGSLLAGTAFADPQLIAPPKNLPALAGSGSGLQPSPHPSCRWVKDTSGIPDPNKPTLVLSCLPKP